jgi:hypothetical protein
VVTAADEASAAAAARESEIPILLILDYAETRSGISKFLAEITEDGPPANIRVLLLARSAGEWWQQLITSATTILSETLAAVQPIALGPLTGPSGQHEVFQQAGQAFAAELDTDWPDTAQLPPVGSRAPALVVHAAALLAVLEHRSGQLAETGLRSSDVIAGLLRHEARYWQQSQASYRLALSPVVTRRTVATGTLVGADGEEAAIRLLSVMDELADPAVRGQAARWLHDLYPPEPGGTAASEWIASLRPDLVAENLVIGVFSDQPQLLLALTGSLPEQRAGRALTLLARAALSDPEASALIYRTLTSDFPRLAVPALAVATETNPQIGEQLADILEHGRWPLQLLKQIGRPLPASSIALARAAAATFQRLVDETTRDSEERGASLINLSYRLSQLGRREDAVAATRPDAHLHDLAGSLSNQSVLLSELGRHEDALTAINESVTTYRQLAATRPQIYTAQLISSLKFLAATFASLGMDSEAARIEAEMTQLQ